MNAKVREIMKTDVYTVTDEANIGEVIRILVDNQINGVPIVDGKEKVVGFISDGDIMKFVAKQNPRIIDMTSFITVWYDTESFEKKMDDLMDLNVMELATTKLVSVEADYDIDEAAKVLGDKKIKKVPVLENGKLVGVITRSDILRYILGRSLQHKEEK
ncbi:MAG: CBS domain-containing protein [Peptococcaceae bacterium]|nr:CBS domain-containing protein [Peptococcaceae bacterium]